MGILPNTNGMEDLVRRMEGVAYSMAESAARTEAAAERMLQAAKIAERKK